MEVKNYNVEYIDEGHIYLVNGVITPSVSEILRFIFPEKYANIPTKILNEKAEFGTHVHNAIERYENGESFELTPKEQLCFDQYLKIKKLWVIDVIEQETIVHYKDRFAGRLDMIATVVNTDALIDIKTTSKLDEEYLSWQLGFYAMAYEWLFGITFDKFYALWLPKLDLGAFLEIEPKTKEEILKVLDDYENARKI